MVTTMRKLVNIFLDDLRDCPPEFLLSRNAEEAKELLLLCDGHVNVLSLDNDLGENQPEGRHVLNWLEEQIHFDRLERPTVIRVHSANPVARQYMNATIQGIYGRQQEN